MNPGTKPMKRSAPMKRCAMPRPVATTSVPAKRPAKVDHGRKPASQFRSAPYLALIRTLPCIRCGAQDCSQAAHANLLMFGKGKGQKASDAAAMPLCGPRPGIAGCHATLDQGGTMHKVDRQLIECYWIAQTIISLVLTEQLVGAPAVIAKVPASSGDSEATALLLVGLVESGQLRVRTARAIEK